MTMASIVRPAESAMMNPAMSSVSVAIRHQGIDLIMSSEAASGRLLGDNRKACGGTHFPTSSTTYGG